MIRRASFRVVDSAATPPHASCPPRIARKRGGDAETSGAWAPDQAPHAVLMGVEGSNHGRRAAFSPRAPLCHKIAFLDGSEIRDVSLFGEPSGTLVAWTGPAHAAFAAPTSHTGGVPPVRVERIEPPRIDVNDLGAVAIIEQRAVFVAAKRLAREAPDNIAWRWKAWLTHAGEFDRLFVELDTTK